MQKCTLITGGAGFVGSHLCEYLLKRGDFVICVDNLCTGTKRNIAHLLSRPSFMYVEHDIEKPLSISKPITHIYNLASPASPPQYQKNPIHTLLTNVVGMKNALDLAVEKRAAILQASTSEVYGDPLEHPQKETYFGNVNTIGVRSCYDEGKRAAETLCFDYKREHETPVRVVRIFNTYGPRMRRDDGRVISNFISQALRDEPLTIYGDGTHTRSFQYIDDLVLGMVKMMEQEDPGPVNLGNPEEHKIKELAERILRATGSRSKIVHKSLPEDDPTRRKPDITKAKKLLDWEPAISLEEGLRITIKYFRECV